MQWIDIVQTIGIIISIVLVVWQVRIQTNQMKSTVNSLLTTKLDEINRLMFDNPELLPELDKSYPDQGGEGDRRHYLLFIIFNTFKQVFLQHSKYGFIDQNDWVPWVRTMTGILKKPYVEGHWQATKYHYAKDFQKYVDDLMNKQPTLKEIESEPPRSVSKSVLKYRLKEGFTQCGARRQAETMVRNG